MGSYFADIDLNVEESANKGLPPTKKKKARSKRKMVYKYPDARKLFSNLSSKHSVDVGALGHGYRIYRFRIGENRG